MSDVDTCLVIGASGAVGSAVASRLQQAGYKLILTATRLPPRNGTQLVDLRSCEWRELDVADYAQTEAIVTEAAQQSSNRFHLVYCAGRIADKPIAQLRPEDWHHVLEVNLHGAFYALRASFQKLAFGGVGRIALISSISGRRAQSGQAAYGASKAGLEALCRVAAVELGRFGVTCNVVASGPLDAGMMSHVRPAVVESLVARTPLRRLGTPQDVGSAVEFLLSPGARHITGQTITVDGGFTAC